MKQFFGSSQRGDLKEAVRGLQNPQLILLMSNQEQFETHVQELERLYPRVPSIGCIGMSYDTKIVEKGVGVVAFGEGVSAVANVLEQVSTMPVKYIERLQRDVRMVSASQKDTICLDFCSGNDRRWRKGFGKRPDLRRRGCLCAGQEQPWEDKSL